jgi:transcription initiation factor TFIID subunit 8
VLTELGRTTRQFTELAGRIEPNVGDVTMAFADLGIKIDPIGLRTFMKRHGRGIVANPQGLPQSKNPTILSVGKRKSLPSYIPEYFPPLPDPHTYIRTPVSCKF